MWLHELWKHDFNRYSNLKQTTVLHASRSSFESTSFQSRRPRHSSTSRRRSTSLAPLKSLLNATMCLSGGSSRVQGYLRCGEKYDQCKLLTGETLCKLLNIDFILPLALRSEGHDCIFERLRLQIPGSLVGGSVGARGCLVEGQPRPCTLSDECLRVNRSETYSHIPHLNSHFDGALRIPEEEIAPQGYGGRRSC